MSMILLVPSVDSVSTLVNMDLGDIVQALSPKSLICKAAKRGAIHVEKVQVDLDRISHLVCNVSSDELDLSPVPNA